MHPVIFEIGSFELRSYGLFVALAFFTGFFLLYKEAKRKNFYPDKILDLELCILIFGVIGARLLHVLVNFSYYCTHVTEIFMIWRGGLAIYGGLIAGMAASSIFIVRKKMPFLRTADFIIPYIALGQSVGRIGCFINGCCFGKTVSHSIPGVIFPGETVARHPTQLYASLALLLIFVILKLAGERKPGAGFIFGLYLILYSLQRFCIDFLRADTPRYLFNLTTSQLISASIFVCVITIMLFRKTWKY